MKYIIQLMILTRCLLIQGGLEWKVLKKITDYGQNVTLFCNVSNCCPKLAGWDKYTPAQQTIFIDVKTWKPTKKYDGKVLTDGYTLIIQNLTEEDLNVSYACVYGSTIGDKQSLLEENVFNYMSTTQHNGPIHNRTFSVENMGTTHQTGQIDNRIFSAGKIVGIVFGVFVAVSVVSSVIFFWKRRREMHRNIGNGNAGSDEDVPLLNPFLEEPNDIHCIEGEDAIFTCKLKPDIPTVKWLKNGRELTQTEKYIISMEDTQHKLTLKNTTESDSGDYYVQVGLFSQKIQLNITEKQLEQLNMMSVNESKKYIDQIQSKTEARQYVRLHVIGKDGVGKTSLVKRLLFPDEHGIRSNDGIRVYRKFLIGTKNDNWIVEAAYMGMDYEDHTGTVLRALFEAQYFVSTLPSHVRAKETMLELQQKPNDTESMPADEDDEVSTLNDENHYTRKAIITPNKYSNEHIDNIESNTEKPKKILQNMEERAEPLYAEKQNHCSVKVDKITQIVIEKMNDIILNAKNGKEKMKSKNLIECGIWEFAGQREYYATYHSFFSPNAIYLLVVDLNVVVDDMDNMEPDIQIKNFNAIGDDMDFWFDSIHCLCEDLSDVKLCPPVIIVINYRDLEQEVRRLVANVFTIVLSSDQQKQIVDEIEKVPALVNNIGLTSHKLPDLVENNLLVATKLLLHVGQDSTSKRNEYFAKLVNMDLSVNSMNVVKILITEDKLPSELIQRYISNSMSQCRKMKETHLQNRWVRRVCEFVEDLIINKRILKKDIHDTRGELLLFCSDFTRIPKASGLFITVLNFFDNV